MKTVSKQNCVLSFRTQQEKKSEDCVLMFVSINIFLAFFMNKYNIKDYMKVKSKHINLNGA